MRITAFVALYALAIIMAIATLIGSTNGTSAAHSLIYGTAWFKTAWMVLIFLQTIILVRYAKGKRISFFLLHLSFVLIFIGGIATSFTAKKGILHLREGETAKQFLDNKGHWTSMPFTIRLDNFRIAYYEGTETHKDYVSQVTCHTNDERNLTTQISMNQILTLENYRLYQTSYDNDLKGTTLTVYHNPWGIGLTYVGYILFILGAILSLSSPHGSFRNLLRHPLLKRSGLFAVATLMGMACYAHHLPHIDRSQADSMRSRPIVYHHRIAPLNTLARDFLFKVYGKPSYQGLTAEQVVGSWMQYSEEWNNTPIIYIKDQNLRKLLGLNHPYASLSDLYHNGEYKLASLYQQEHQLQSRLAKAIRETDEKVGLIQMLTQGHLIKEVPDNIVLDKLRLTAELWYHRIAFTAILFIVCLIWGVLSAGWMVYRMLKRRKEQEHNKRLWNICLYVVTSFHLIGYILRWYVSGNIPLGNGYETMLFMALCFLLTGCLLQQRFPFVRPFALMLAGFTLLVAHLGEMNPQITPLMPVLNSPWLSTHVSFIMISYALFGFILLNGCLAILLRCKKDKIADEQMELLTILSRLLLYPATFLLGIGIILGSVWANVSWGSYWSWDAKEVWALITFIIYSVPLHSKSMRCWRHPLRFHLYMIGAFITVLMTYFGVNYLNGGMHSYM